MGNAQRQWDVRGSRQEGVRWASGISSYNPCTVINDHSPGEGTRDKGQSESASGHEQGEVRLNLAGGYDGEKWGGLKESTHCGNDAETEVSR